MGRNKRVTLASDVPLWINQPGALLRAKAKAIIFIGAFGELKSHPSYRKAGQAFVATRRASNVVAVKDDLGIYLGQIGIVTKSLSNRNILRSIPTFWFNGHKFFLETTSFEGIFETVEHKSPCSAAEGGNV